jgi:hypothetical protein
MGLGLSVAIVAGWIIGRLKMEAYLEDWVRDMPKTSAQFEDGGATLADRIEGGIALGALIHGYVPEDFMASFMGKEAWWSVPLIATFVGVVATGILLVGYVFNAVL